MAAIVLLSGGLDSAVNLKCAVDDVGVALALTFDYGQRAAPREITAAGAMARALGLRHRVVALPWLGEIATSALVNLSREIPVVTAAGLDHLPADTGFGRRVGAQSQRPFRQHRGRLR